MKFLTPALLLFGVNSASAEVSLNQIRLAHNLPALATGVLEKGQIQIRTVGVRKMTSTVKATNSDQWHLGSNGKAITATLAAVLIEKGDLNWQTTLGDVFNNWKVHPEYKGITLKELFAHRAGVTADVTKFLNGKYWHEFLNSSESVEKLRTQYVKSILESSPSHSRDKFSYSNSGYIVAAVVLSHLTGEPWEVLIKRYIFGPLQLTSCGFGAAGSESPVQPVQPWPHNNVAGVPIAISPGRKEAENPPALGPAGTIHCSLKDWLKFAKLHLDGFNGIDTKILSASGFDILHRDYDGQGYTSGGFIYEKKKDGRVVLGHNGTNSMNFAILTLDPANDSAYVAVTNMGPLSGEKGTQEAMRWMGSPDVCLGSFCLLTK